jgi:hypothetical protein
MEGNQKDLTYIVEQKPGMMAKMLTRAKASRLRQTGSVLGSLLTRGRTFNKELAHSLPIGMSAKGVNGKRKKGVRKKGQREDGGKKKKVSNQSSFAAVGACNMASKSSELHKHLRFCYRGSIINEEVWLLADMWSCWIQAIRPLYRHKVD